STTRAPRRLAYEAAHSFCSAKFRGRKTFLPCSRATRACIFAPEVELASITTVPCAMPDIVTFRLGKVYEAGGALGQNCDTTAPDAAIRSLSSAFSAG